MTASTYVKPSWRNTASTDWPTAGDGVVDTASSVQTVWAAFGVFGSTENVMCNGFGFAPPAGVVTSQRMNLSQPGEM